MEFLTLLLIVALTTALVLNRREINYLRAYTSTLEQDIDVLWETVFSDTTNNDPEPISNINSETMGDIHGF